MPEVDARAVIPEVRDVARAAATSYLRHLEPWLVGLLIHGSSVKGGFIPFASDLDFQVYLEDAAFDETGQIPLRAALAIHADLAKIDLGIVDYIQCFPLSRHGRQDWTPPIPGTYQVLAGELPLAPATAEQLISSAHSKLSTLTPLPFRSSNSLLDAGQARLDRVIRLLSTDVWPTLYQVLVCLSDDPLRVWTLPKQRAIELLPEGESPRTEISRFYAAVVKRSRQSRDTENGLEVVRRGVDFLVSARQWYERTQANGGT